MLHQRGGYEGQAI